LINRLIIGLFSFGVAMISNASEVNFFQAEDVFDLEYASDIQVSPRGFSIVYVRKTNDIMTDKTRSNIWWIDTDGTNHRPVLSGRQNFSSPRWSPDGSRLAYLSSVEGDTQLYVRYIESGDSALITNVQNAPSSISWSPDGRQIALIMRVPKTVAPIAKARKIPKGANWAKPAQVIDSIPYQRDGQGIVAPGFQHIFVVSAEGGQPRQITQGDFNHRGPLSWHPDSKKLIFSANRHENWMRQSRESNIFEVNVGSSELSQITDMPGTEQRPQYDSRGERIAYISGNNLPVSYRNTRLVIISADGGDERVLTSGLDSSINRFYWGEKDSKLFVEFDERAKRKVASVSLNGDITRLVDDVGGTVVGRPYLSGEFHIGGRDVIAYTSAVSGRPADVSVLIGKETSRLTELNKDLFHDITLGEVREITFLSSYDGQKIQGWYVLPPDFSPFERYPLILEIHGGPFAAYGDFFSAELQLLAAAGYVVFYDNHRGSTSYGEEFAMLLHQNYSSQYDFADHMSGVDAMLSKEFVDQNNLFIAGGSAGGIATAYAIGLTNRFNAAVAAKPVVNWISKTLTADSSVGQIQNQFPGYPWDHFRAYWQRSPLSLVGKVKTPTLLITGEKDRRTPISETEQYFQALQLLSVPSAMVRLPDSPHGIARRPSRLIAKVDNILAWFERYKVDVGN
jgi:dipeptidyl aminopeptidase/acylaminoacyl peptidase